MEKKYDVFISYSDKDRDMVSTICNKFEEIGLKCWFAYRDIPPGEKWSSHIVGAIKASKVFLLVFSSNSNTSDEVEKEIGLGLKYCDALIPFRIEDIPLSDSIEYHLNNVHWIDAYTDPREQHFLSLAERVLNALPERKKAIEMAIKEEPEIKEEYDVFISYASSDLPIADELRSFLLKKQISCWMAPYSVKIGESYSESIRSGIENSKIFMPILSNQLSTLPQAINEISMAYDNELKVIPLRIEEVKLSSKIGLYICNIQYYDFQTRDEAVYEDLINTINFVLKKSKKW